MATERDPLAARRDPLATELTRRRFLQGTAFAGFAAFLAACTTGTSGSNPPASVSIPTPPPATPTPAPASPTPVPSPTGPLKFANWPAYIDLTGKAYDTGEYTAGSSPTIEQFKDKYKIE